MEMKLSELEVALKKVMFMILHKDVIMISSLFHMVRSGVFQTIDVLRHLKV